MALAYNFLIYLNLSYSYFNRSNVDQMMKINSLKFSRVFLGVIVNFGNSFKIFHNSSFLAEA